MDRKTFLNSKQRDGLYVCQIDTFNDVPMHVTLERRPNREWWVSVTVGDLLLHERKASDYNGGIDIALSLVSAWALRLRYPDRNIRTAHGIPVGEWHDQITAHFAQPTPAEAQPAITEEPAHPNAINWQIAGVGVLAATINGVTVNVRRIGDEYAAIAPGTMEMLPSLDEAKAKAEALAQPAAAEDPAPVADTPLATAEPVSLYQAVVEARNQGKGVRPVGGGTHNGKEYFVCARVSENRGVVLFAAYVGGLPLVQQYLNSNNLAGECHHFSKALDAALMGTAPAPSIERRQHGKTQLPAPTATTAAELDNPQGDPVWEHHGAIIADAKALCARFGIGLDDLQSALIEEKARQKLAQRNVFAGLVTHSPAIRTDYADAHPRPQDLP